MEGITISVRTNEFTITDLGNLDATRQEDDLSHCTDQEASSSWEDKGGRDFQEELEGEQAEIKILPPPACWYKSVDIPKVSIGTNCDNGSCAVSPVKRNHDDAQSNEYIGLTSNCPDSDALIMKDCAAKSLCAHSTAHLSSAKDGRSKNILPTISSAIAQNISTLKTITTTVLPPLAQELVSASAVKACHYTRLSYSNSKLFGKHYLQNSEVGNRGGGYDRRAIREVGIRDVTSGQILWKEGMILDQDGHLVLNQSKDDENESSEQQLICGQDDDNLNESLSREEEAKEGALVRKVNEKEAIPSGPGWEDEWDKSRLSLPPFSSLSWVDRQLIKEWRTCDYLTKGRPVESIEENLAKEDEIEIEKKESLEDELQEDDFDQARMLLPQPIQKPPWENASSCYACRRGFGAKLRHHCRLCGRSYCQSHSRWSHKLPHLGYSPDVPERVCAPCKQMLESQNLAERIAWRMARCRDFLARDLCPYFETGVDTVEDAAARLAKAAIRMAKSIPLGAQATMTVETLDVLRKHGLKGVYGLILRKEFMAAADLLCKVTGINKKVWPLSVHELSAAIFYALAQHRALRGVDPEREHRIHAFKTNERSPNIISTKENNRDRGGFHISCETEETKSKERFGCDLQNGSISEENQTNNILVDETDNYDPRIETTELEHPIIPTTEKSLPSNLQPEDDSNESNNTHLPFDPVCDPVSDGLLSSLIFYSPLALHFIYATSEVDMQILAAQQGWRLLHAHLSQEDGTWGGQVADKPASALFVHSEQKIACFAIRGTATINDVVTDIRAMPVQFPDSEMDGVHRIQSRSEMNEEGWTPVSQGQGLALCGMAGAACNLFRENIDSILLLARQGYRIRLTGHSLGGSVAALLGALIKRHFEFHLPRIMSEDNETLRVYSYGSPACVDAKLSDHALSYVTNCVLHDDVIPRLTPTSIRALLKHLLYIRETWVKAHLSDDLMAITERAKTAVSQRCSQQRSFYPLIM